MRFGPTQQGGVNASVFIEFLKRLIAGAARVIFLIVDRGPAHIARKTRAFVERLNGSLRLFYLPPYAPDRNPDERVGKHPNADAAGRMGVAGRPGFQRKVRSSMRQLQNNPGKIISFFPETLAQIRRLNVLIFMNCLSGDGRAPHLVDAGDRHPLQQIRGYLAFRMLAARVWLAVNRRNPSAFHCNTLTQPEPVASFADQADQPAPTLAINVKAFAPQLRRQGQD